MKKALFFLWLGSGCTLLLHPARVTCGDKILQAFAETCDDGNTDAGDGCDSDCQAEPGFICPDAPGPCEKLCGNGVSDAQETCDDGNTDAGDGCDTACQVELGFSCVGAPSDCEAICGDGLLRASEVCDDGNTDAGDGCDAACQIENGFECIGEPSVCALSCGDATLDNGEACDDGDNDNDDGCDSDCQVELGFTCTGTPSVCELTCSNGVTDTNLGEECDDGNLTAGDACEPNCQLPECGDTFLNPGTGEECDDGNTQGDDGCDSFCVIEFCGDNTINNSPNEQCDNGANNSNIIPDACRTNCQNPSCGDNVLDSGEECDDGNNDVNDGCSDVCILEFCSDGIINNGDEECDDGNQTNGDGCNNNCVLERCGDGIVNNNPNAANPNEECDDGNQIDTDTCTDLCRLPACGDGTFSDGEFCGFVLLDQLPTGAGPVSLVAATFNNDTALDLAVANKTGDSESIFFGAGNGGFTLSQTITQANDHDSPQFLLAGDFGDPSIQTDNDLELVALFGGGSASGQRFKILENNNGTFLEDQTEPNLGNLVFGAAGDIDKDGRLDLVVSDIAGDRVGISFNQGGENVEPPTFISTNPGTQIDNPVSLALADFNGDTNLEIAVIGKNSNNLGFLKNIAGSFLLLTTGVGGISGPTSIAAAFLNNDNIPDLAITAGITNQVHVLFGTGTCNVGSDCVNGNASFIIGTGANPLSVKIADLNRDGALDIATINQTGNSLSVFLGDGSGVFALPPASAETVIPANAGPVDLVFADFDNNGVLDLATANQTANTLSIFLAKP